MPEEVPLMDEEKTRLESSLHNLFDKNIKPTIEKEAVLKNIQLSNTKKNGKRHECEFFHVDLTYQIGREEKTLPILLKKTKEIKDANYEGRIYDFYKNIQLECLVKFHGQLRDSNTHENMNYLALELFGYKEKFDGLTLEEKLKEFNQKLEDNNGNKEKVNEIMSDRIGLLRNITNVVATFNYGGTKRLLIKASEDKEKKIYTLTDNENERWSIKTHGKEYYKQRFLNDMGGTYNYYKEPFGLTKHQIARYMRTIEKIITPPKGSKSMFAWAEFGPMPLLVHRDLHIGNILVSDNNIKIIDLKNVGVGSMLIDLGFTQNPYFNPSDEERRHLLDTYLTGLKIQSDKDSSRIEIMTHLKEKTDFYEFDKQDRLRQIAWNIRIAKEICGYDIKEVGKRYQQDLDKHLRYTHASLKKIVYLDYIMSEYSYLRRLLNFFEKTQVSKTYNHPKI